LDFSLGGVDGNDRYFEETIVTHDLSECGGSFISARAIKVGSTLKLSDNSGFISLISITWGNKIFNSKLKKFGFQFVHPSDH